MADAFAPVLAALSRAGRPSSDFDLNPPDPALAATRELSPAGVLIALSEGPSGLDLWLTKRSSRLKHHPGQIALPGGKVDATDADVTAAALREAHEEIGLDPAQVTVLGLMPPHETVTGYAVTPVIGRLAGPFTPRPEPGEVDEVFRMPFAHAADPARYRIEGRDWRGQFRRYYVLPHGPYYIWGATARILRALADRMG